MEVMNWILPVLMATVVLVLFWISHKRAEKKMHLSLRPVF